VNEDLQSYEERLKKLRLIEPSKQLKEKVTHAAMSVWHQETMDVAWWIPVRRLGIAAAAALILVSLANYAGDQAGMKWQIADKVRVSEPVSDLDEAGDATDVVLVRHLTVPPLPIDMAAVREYQEQIRQMLDEQG
jgi:hypothetical protein